MKKRLIVVAASALLATGLAFNTQSVDAASMNVTKTSYVYNIHGKRTKRAKIKRGRRVKSLGIKWIKGKYYLHIGKNQYIRYSNVSAKKAHHKKDNRIYTPEVEKHPTVNLDNHPNVPDAKTLITNASDLPAGTKYTWETKPEFKADGETDGTILITYPDKSKDEVEVSYKYYGTNHVVLPADYTLDGLEASDDSPTQVMVKAAEEGYEKNNFISESPSDDQEKVKIDHLTPDQQQRLSEFAIKMINEARQQLGRPATQYGAGTQQLANDVAREYEENDRTGFEGHYVPGLVKAAAKNGLDIDDNYIEDLYAISSAPTKTMTDLKKLAYDSVTSFLFNPDEFHHAADIMDAHSDESWNADTATHPFAISISKTDGAVATHFIHVPGQFGFDN
ncbi:SEC10/PgrA surface exclusion domain-containing protein [Lactobacillus sp. HT06-2]|uniref:SEC10/PgrA surface exclusion domain-containing protein n=1 Tax=Lactobacillus sp. HT06-2 TaxID=2080222 RepID=UPI0013747F90|nr:SEC10/PgrA surface exclusion domain-containing protein [Lactobacillus sp. HT06-2]